jgi:hypothetical protein
VDISYTPPGPIASDYISDRSFVSLIEGPVGSGKTVASLMKGVSVSLTQEPYERIRYSRGMVLRNTYPELRSTVIKSFQEWFPEEVAPINWASPITAKFELELPDKTRMRAEILFLALDRPEDVGKLKSLELTWAAGSEMSEIPKAVFDMMTQRVGRYPPKRWGGATWYGAFGDTNFPDDDHWIYRIFEEEKPEGFKVYKQPGGLIDKGGVYVENPEAENIPNLPGGYEYYLKQIQGKNKEWIKVYACAQYGTISSGKPVYPEYNDDLHCKDVKPYPGLPLLLGFDYGLTPACVVGQINPRGQLRIFADLLGEDMGIRQFARDSVKPFIAMNFPGYRIQATGDPAGNRRADSDEKTCFMELAEAGIPAMPAITNEFVARREAVASYLTKLIDGQGGLAVHPDSRLIRKGFNGGYHYKRVQVTGDERYRDVPEKNSYSHPHDALQYMALFSKTYHASQDFGKKIEYPKMGIV